MQAPITLEQETAFQVKLDSAVKELARFGLHPRDLSQSRQARLAFTLTQFKDGAEAVRDFLSSGALLRAQGKRN